MNKTKNCSQNFLLFLSIGVADEAKMLKRKNVNLRYLLNQWDDILDILNVCRVSDIIMYFVLYHLGCRYFVCFEFIGVADEAVLPDPPQPTLDHTSIRKCKSVGNVNQFK